MLEYLIIGGGISGVSLGRLLQQAGSGDFVILEAAAKPGGLCRSETVDGHVVDLGGGHSLCTNFPEVYDFVYQHLPADSFRFYERVSKIHLDEGVVDYPLEANLWQLPAEAQAEYLISLIGGRDTAKAEPRNYEEWIRTRLGRKIAEDYLLPYNRKLWGIAAKDMAIDWLHKIPRLDAKEALLRTLCRSEGRDTIPNHPVFYYPDKGGFQSVFDAIYRHTAARTVLAEPVVKLRYSGGRWIVNDTYEARRIVNTAPWPALYGALRPPAKLARDFARLRHNSVVVSLWEEEFGHDWHWSYFPGDRQEYHRRFYIRNFAPDSKPGGIFSETNTGRWPGRGQLWRDGVKPLYEHVNEYAYPLPVRGYAGAVANIRRYYRERNFYSLGRWGQWQYLDADACIREAMNLAAVLRDACA